MDTGICNDVATAKSHTQRKDREVEPLPEATRKRQRPDSLPSMSDAVSLSMRGLNIQWPFSQLLLKGVKTQEIRKYSLDYRGIAKTDEVVWIVETKGPHAKATKNAIIGDLQIAPRPSAAQIVGTVKFGSYHRYATLQAFEATRDEHRIAAGSKHDWSGSDECYGWRVEKVQALVAPVSVGTTGQTGFGPRRFQVVFDTETANRSEGRCCNFST